ncbi:hypothetical protein OIDMADRAFT_55771 [Oidiodendron maius Zn]|uniref:Uncharacterized protein n=1 Tax=Oidiodendron maius (strain Zn) TaxID=913774 RepID=A0A0C3H9D5_OIDMZ|nr:hypothetical protein OIDMADRAFT_55771 [Oidiodendron maius Zn]
MPKMVCRITWQKGKPLGLAVYPSVTFLHLPREVRDQIYYEALVVSRPITVSSMTVEDPVHVEYTETKQKTISQKYIIEGRDQILEEITLGLLRCQKQVSSEASVTFYQLNTFYFGGNEVWNPLYTFLKGIGGSKRHLLQSVSVNVDPYKQVYQDRYGARITTHRGRSFWLNSVHSFASPAPLQPPSLYTRRQPMPPPPGTIQVLPRPFARLIPRNEFVSRPLQYFDPAIQACIRLLSSSGSSLTLRLVLTARVPGVYVDPGSSLGLSMELPDFIEGLRHEFAMGVTVLWNCSGRSDTVINQIHSIQEKGWEILETMERLVDDELMPALPPIPVTRLVLRRKEMDKKPSLFCESCYTQWPSKTSKVTRQN